MRMQGGLVESRRVLPAIPCRIAVLGNRPFGPPRAERPRCVQAKLSDALGKGSVFFASEALDIGLGPINFSFAIMLYLLFFFVRDGEGLTRRITHAIPLLLSSSMPSSTN